MIRVIMGIFALAVFLTVAPTASALEDDGNEGVEVECDRVDSWAGSFRLIPVSHVTVYGNEQAAAACNQTEYECRNRCVACVNDYDLSEDVCVTTAGQQFLK